MQVLEVFNRHQGRMAISSITLAELFHGAEKSSVVEKNIAVVEDFIGRLTVSPYDEKAAWHYGSIRAALEKSGLPIGVNDLHIAAHARSSGLVLVTNNLREFDRVPGLLLENWLETYWWCKVQAWRERYRCHGDSHAFVYFGIPK